MDFDSKQLERQEERKRLLGDRSFTLRGETFSYVANSRYDVLRRVSELSETSAGTAVLTTLESAVIELIEDTPEINGDGKPSSSHERFREICQREDFPITFEDLNEIATWLIEKQVDRPTQAPSSSPDGRDSTGTNSTDTSSLKQDVASPN
jgi:hypothetical protein